MALSVYNIINNVQLSAVSQSLDDEETIMTHRILKNSLAILIACLYWSNSLAVSCEVVAKELNYRFYRDLDCANNEPSYACSGVLLHTIESLYIDAPVDDSSKICTYDSTAPWCPNASDIKRKIVSFSYLHNDVSASYGYPIFPNQAGTLGYVFYPQSIKELYICSFPIDGMSFAREDCGCGAWAPPECSLTASENQSTCEKQGVISADDFYNHFINGEHHWKLEPMCSFGKSQEQFNALIQTTQLIVNEQQPLSNWNTHCDNSDIATCMMINEVVLKGWFDVPYAKIPIEAFFYVTGSNNLYKNSIKAQKTAQKYARQFSKNLSKPIPVVGIDIQKFHKKSNKNDGPFFCQPHSGL